MVKYPHSEQLAELSDPPHMPDVHPSSTLIGVHDTALAWKMLQNPSNHYVVEIH